MKFKTNINCSGCVSKVTPALNSLVGIEKWDVDINDPRKILTVISDTCSIEDIISKIRATGFEVEKVN